MRFKTINPATEKVIAEYETASPEVVGSVLKQAEAEFPLWRDRGIGERAALVRNLAGVLRKNKEKYARLMTLEMGKPVKESLFEVEKCAGAAEFYADISEQWLAEEDVEADGESHKVILQPLGVILSVMPWNFPFWQVFRFAMPSLIAGNVSILKHSNIVPQCALAIEDIFRQAGFPDGTFKTIIADHEAVSGLIESDVIRGVSLTGSSEAGQIIASQAGANLKKVVLELGGSDPFIVLEDADLDFTTQNAVTGRMMNAGQVCISSKRFIVLEEVVDEFTRMFVENVDQLNQGDPMQLETDIGPLVNLDTLVKIEEQVAEAVSGGANVLTGGKRLEGKGYFYPPTLLSNVNMEMKVMKEETFGPVGAIFPVKDVEEAVAVANATQFGLAGTVWTRDIARGEAVARRIEAGAVFVNSISKSDPRMPFGGIKESGMGRELSRYGFLEFVNIKGLNVYQQP